MIKGIYLAARSLDAKMKNLNIVANNLANINTTAFKKELPFSEIIDSYGNVQVKQLTDYKQGNLVQTSNPLNMGISGNGFFVVQTKNGMQLTRDGNFQVSPEGFLVDKDGNKVMGKNGAISLNTLSLENDHTITVQRDGEIKQGDKIIDSLLIAKMDQPENAYRTAGVDFLTGNTGIQAASEQEYQIRQGYLEESNVNPIQQMEQMIQLNNDFSSSQKMINFLDKSLDEANQIGTV